MTLRKYKKLLMSCGLDRDFAEYERKELAISRAHMSQKSYEYFTGLYRELASRYVSVCGGNLRDWKRKVKDAISHIPTA